MSTVSLQTWPWGHPDLPPPPTLTGSPLHLLIPMQGGTWSAEKVIQVPSKKVKGWILPEMPGGCPGVGGNQ